MRKKISCLNQLTAGQYNIRNAVLSFALCFCSIAMASSPDAEIAASQPGLIARGGYVGELDPKHKIFSKKLHKIFNEHDTRGTQYQISADYRWMPPLDIEGKGYAIYKNAGKYVLEVDAHIFRADEPPYGYWVMLFNQDGDLINDIYFGAKAFRDTHIIYLGDMDNDKHLEWLTWGAIVLDPGRDKQNTDWMDVENKYSNVASHDYVVRLHVMNKQGVLEYKRGKAWSLQYKYAAEKMCSFVGGKPYSLPDGTSGSDSIQEMLPISCLSALEGTTDIDYILASLNRLQEYPRTHWPIQAIAEELNKQGLPALKQALDRKLTSNKRNK